MLKNRSFLQFFGGEDEPDLEALQAEFEKEWNPEEVTDDEPEKHDETPEPSEEIDDQPESPDDEPEEPNDVPEKKEERSEPEFPEQKQNEAFARMRRELEESKKFQSFVEKLAEQNGMKPEDVIQAYEQRQLEQEAEKQNVPVEVMQRLKQLEKENQSTKEQSFAERFNNEVKSTIEKYELKDSDVSNVMQFMAQKGLDPRKNSSLSFEDAYILANKDNLMKQAEEKGRQAYLEQKKQKQEGATVATGGGIPSDSNKTDFSEEDIFKKLEEFDIPL